MTTADIWSPSSYWNKAVLYLQRANKVDSDDELRVLLHSFSLEALARSALTTAHPSLNADPQGDGAHLLFACGFSGDKPPKSLPVHAVFGRLGRMHPTFKTHEKFCGYMITLRNEELHSGGLPFDGLSEAKWLAQFYAAVDCLCDIAKREIDHYLGEHTEHAKRLIEALRKDRKADVKRRLAEHKKAFEELPTEEQIAKRHMAIVAASRRPSAVVKCPACGSDAMASGSPIASSNPKLDVDELYIDVTHEVVSTSCLACGLQLRSVAECHIAEVPPRFVESEPTDLHVLHEDEEYEEYDNM